MKNKNKKKHIKLWLFRPKKNAKPSMVAACKNKKLVVLYQPDCLLDYGKDINQRLSVNPSFEPVNPNKFCRQILNFSSK